MIRRAALSAVIALAGVALPAQAGVAGDTRVSGQYRIQYVKVAGESGGPFKSQVWSITPLCADGPCALRIRIRQEGVRAGTTNHFDFDGTTYQWSKSAKGVGPCVTDSGTTLAEKAYDDSAIARFRVTRSSPSARALTFKGTLSVRYTVNAIGRAKGCGSYYTQTQRFTGYAVTR